MSAHRGGARPSFPENCLATFEDTLRHTYAMIEIDPRYTNDHQIVLHHDVSLERTTSGHGRVADHTLQELKSLRLKDSEGELTEFTIPTLDEALVWARGKAILVLDQKDVTLQDRIKKIEEHHAEGYAILIVSNYEQVRECHKRNPEIMMEVMIPTREKLQRFSSLGVPFGNVVAFVGHDPPADEELLKNLHAKQVCCIAGTSRNLDRQWPQARETAGPALQAGYRSLPAMGVDLIETDIPTKLGRLLYADGQVPAAKAEYFHRP